jgi:flagellar hook-associated protein 1 FlgK
VQQINTVLERIQTYNRELRSNAAGQEDPGIDANMHAAFEELSGLVSFDILKHDDGSVDLLLGGQTPVLVGDRLYPISAETNNLGAIVRDAQGHDITATLTKGELGAILEVRNVTVPGYQADLDRLASTLADRINGILAGGLDLNGNSPIANLFTYDPSQGAASTLALNNLSTDDLAAASSTAPGGNGNALELAKLANSKEIDGFTLIEFYGSIGGRLGRDIATAREGADTMTALVSQAKTFREEVSGVSLDEEAAKLLQFQRSYEAAARLVKSLDEMTQSLISILS